MLLSKYTLAIVNGKGCLHAYVALDWSSSVVECILFGISYKFCLR